MTTLQILISNWTTELENNNPNSPIYKCFINEAESFLEKEKQQIIIAFIQGQHFSEDYIDFKQILTESEQYYKETYENK